MRDESCLVMRVLKHGIDISLKMSIDKNDMEQITRKIQKSIQVFPYIF